MALSSLSPLHTWTVRQPHCPPGFELALCREPLSGLQWLNNVDMFCDTFTLKEHLTLELLNLN